MLPDGNHREIFDIEIDGHRHKAGILFALFDLFGFDLFGLGTMQFGKLGAQHQFGTLLLPLRFCAPLLKVAAVQDGIIGPGPACTCVDLEPHKRLSLIRPVQFEGNGPFIESRMIVRTALPMASLITERR